MSMILLLHRVVFSSLQPGSSLEQTHIFVLAHILRRPIIVYGVKYYKSFRGETLGYTRFQGELSLRSARPLCSTPADCRGRRSHVRLYQGKVTVLY